MAEVIIPVPTTLNIESFSGAQIGRMSSYIENGIVDEFPEGEVYVTQRPGFNTLEDASAVPVDSQGRGIYYWRLSGDTFIVNYDTVYVNSYSGTQLAITAGSQKVYFTEVGTKLVLIDPQNNEGWYITDGAPPTITLISDVNFPDATNSRTLSHGTTTLNNTCYVLANVTANGYAEIWGSDISDGTSWSGTNFLTVESRTDSGVYIDKHHDNVVVFGNESIEFFYDAANETGSPLSPREDISYNMGCADGKSVYTDNDVTYFVSKSGSGGISVHTLTNFQLERISTSPLDSYLTTAITVDGVSVLGSGFYAGGKLFYIITLYETVAGVINPLETLVYNANSKTWTMWEHASSAVTQFPLVGWMTATDSNSSGKGILSNGDYLEVVDAFVPQDTVGENLYVASGYVVAGYITDQAATGDAINMKIRIGHVDMKTRKKKFMNSLRIAGDETETSQTLSISYADDNHASFSVPRTITLNNAEDKLTRLGQFRSRTFQLEYSGTEQLRLHGLEVNVEESAI